MYCPSCGYHDSSFGGQHTCTASELLAEGGPPRARVWQYMTGVVSIAVLACLAAGTARIVLLFRESGIVRRLASDPESLNVAEVRNFIDAYNLVSILYQLALLALLVAFWVWLASVNNAVRPYGDAGRAAVRHRIVLARRVVIGAFIALLIFSIRPSPATAADPEERRQRLLAAINRQLLIEGGRLLWCALVLATVWVLLPRIRALVSGRPVWRELVLALRLRRAKWRDRQAT